MAAELRRALRDAAGAPLPRGAFLRRDRGDALFVTDAARLRPGEDWNERFSRAGFLCREEKGLLRLTPDSAWLVRVERTHPCPPDALSAGLQRYAGRTPAPESLALFALGAKALDGGEAPEGYDRLLRQRAALCLRTGGGGGGLYACAILDYWLRANGGEHRSDIGGICI